MKILLREQNENLAKVKYQPHNHIGIYWGISLKIFIMINVHMSFWKKKMHFTRKKINFWETNLYFSYILGRTNNIQKNNYMFRRKKNTFLEEKLLF